MLWARDGETVIGARNGHTHGGKGRIDLDGVRVFEFDDAGRLKALSVAGKAIHIEGAWTLEDVRRTDFAIDSAKSKKLPSEQWQSNLDPSLLATSIIKPQYMTLRDLGQNIAVLDRNKQDASSFRDAYWQRLFYPLSVLVLAFCAVPFAFGALRSGGLSKRLFLGIVVALGFYLMQRAVINVASVYDIHPAIANLVPPLILVALAGAYFRRHA